MNIYYVTIKNKKQINRINTNLASRMGDQSIGKFRCNQHKKKMKIRTNRNTKFPPYLDINFLLFSLKIKFPGPVYKLF